MNTIIVCNIHNVSKCKINSDNYHQVRSKLID